MSLAKPVVVKVYSSVVADCIKSLELFQNAADVFKGQVVFVSMDIFGNCKNNAGNYQLIQNLMRCSNVSRIQLPTFLFFKDGSLHMPNHFPVAILQGINSGKQLIDFIQKKFFTPTSFSRNFSNMDFTTTRTDCSKNQSSSLSTDNKEKKSVWIRLKRFFGFDKK
jgi:thiol-disulfide isomerase/thioredoxin